MNDVLILGSGSIKNKIHFLKYIFDSPALIPLNTSPVASLVIRFYKEFASDYRIHLSVNKQDLDMVTNEFKLFEDRISYIPINNSKGVVDTLRIAIEEVNPKHEVIVNLVTTIPTVLPQKDEVQISNEYSLSEGWSSIDFCNDDVIFNFKKFNSRNYGYAFTGVFRTDAKSLKFAIKNASETEYSDLMVLVEMIQRLKKLNYNHVDWIDCGHELNYYKAKTKRMSSRSFNHLEVDRIKGVITKSSKHINKLRQEIDYVSLLPKDIAVYFPRVINGIQENNEQATVDMEYYGYPSLSEYLLYWKLDPVIWKEIFTAIKKILLDFKEYKYTFSKHIFIDFYFKKTQDRVLQFKEQIGYNSSLFTDILHINGKDYKNINLLETNVKEKVLSLYSKDNFSIMHGDLCFNNILYDLYSGTVRLIDARGSFGDNCTGIYGDMRYDLAKITHSVIGGYDFIVNGLFYMKEKNNRFFYDISFRSNQNDLIKNNLDIIKYFGFEVEDILFLTSLLFISMCPLHNEDFARQKIFYLHGIKLLNESLGY